MKGPGKGEPWPLGATLNHRGANFALYSAHAERVELCLFDAAGRERRVEVRRRTQDIWHVQVDGIEEGQAYGYRVHGPFDPARGHRFNPALLLLDPYARRLSGVPKAHRGQFDASEDAEGRLVPTQSDNSASAVKSIVTADHPRSASPKPRTPWADTLLYELHVKGLTQLHEALPHELRGRYGGLADDRIVSYLKALGITAVELLPVQEFVDEPVLGPLGLTNYWGYNPIGYFAPTARYAAADPAAEFRGLVQHLHEANIEVILDVVYNHTAEGGRLGPTFSFRGIDNASYYRLVEGDPAQYVNDSGCGNSLDASHPAVLRLIADSLRFWAVEMGVDGFRFDLATSLGRESNGFSSRAPLFHAILQDPVLSRVKLIAEPWDLGVDGYQLGRFPQAFSEWNDRYRDTVRRFWRGDPGILPEFARQLHGASALFEWSGRPPQASINYVASHDGFTLADCVAFTTKRNEENGESNRDGRDENFSSNHGVEGPTDDPGILRLRDKQQRNLLLTLLLSQGVPMLLAGDEQQRTKGGNNNSYCQDNETNWLDWGRLREERLRDFHTFVTRAIALRRSLPELHCDRYVHGHGDAGAEGFDEIEWLHPRGREMEERDWLDPALMTVGLLLNGGEIFRGLGGKTHWVLAYFNGDFRTVPVQIPAMSAAGQWRLVLTSALTPAARVTQVAPGATIALEEQSVCVLLYDEETIE